MTLSPDRLAARFRHFAEAECPEEPLYQALCRIVADDAALLDLLAGASDEQQRPNLWLAAVHEALLAGIAHPLADYYASVGGTRAPDESLAACVRDFAAQHGERLRERMRTRTTQTNEVGRCAVLWPALHAIAARAGTPRLALLDLGCSAGLNLGVDRYAYGDTASADTTRPHLRCRVMGLLQPPAAPTPQLVQREGIDPAPTRIDDEGALRWLRACLWPGDRARAARFDQAVALMREARWPVRQVADCTAEVARWLDTLPADVQPVVFNSWVLTYFERPALQRHRETLTGLVRERGLMWLSAEGPGLRIGPVEVPLPSSPELASGSLWTLARRIDGEARFEVLARSHPHGRWMEWLQP
jgi:hypothetical protein